MPMPNVTTSFCRTTLSTCYVHSFHWSSWDKGEEEEELLFLTLMFDRFPWSKWFVLSSRSVPIELVWPFDCENVSFVHSLESSSSPVGQQRSSLTPHYFYSLQLCSSLVLWSRVFSPMSWRSSQVVFDLTFSHSAIQIKNRAMEWVRTTTLTVDEWLRCCLSSSSRFDGVWFRLSLKEYDCTLKRCTVQTEHRFSFTLTHLVRLASPFHHCTHPYRCTVPSFSG